jgi:carboxypeptidase C (cathepsin A)
MKCFALPALAALAAAAPEADLVVQLPGFAKHSGFKVYSGFLTVPGPLNGYDELKIHYQFQTAQNGTEASKPVVTWHQGGPGGSSIFGQYGEMGYFQVDDAGEHANPYAWNQVANMLYLESPAGSDDPIGFSTCAKGGEVQRRCEWSDVTQAEAYAHTLKAFFAAFPEFASHDLYLSGESYAGQYLPNIAHYILNNKDVVSNLKGIAVGNGCWGGDATTVNCNGPNAEQNDMDMYYGKGLMAKKEHQAVYAACDFPLKGAPSIKCDAALTKASAEVGPHNVYDIYDNCPTTEAWLLKTGKSMRWLTRYLRKQLNENRPRSEWHAELLGMSGGYDWGCNQLPELEKYMQRADVQAALHLTKPGLSGFGYKQSGPASVLLYPTLIQNLRVLIYNGDSDACVPYKGNEEWTTSMVDKGVVTEASAWHPWYLGKRSDGLPPAGYATTYAVTNATAPDASFEFVTVRLAGHMVPGFQPKAALAFFKNFIEGTAL